MPPPPPPHAAHSPNEMQKVCTKKRNRRMAFLDTIIIVSAVFRDGEIFRVRELLDAWNLEYSIKLYTEYTSVSILVCCNILYMYSGYELLFY